MYTRILVPLDGSSLAEQALPYAGLLAGALNIPVSLLNVFDSVPPQFADPGRGLYETQITASYRDNAIDYLQKAGSGLKQSGVTITADAHEGNAAEQIINEAEKDPDTLIAMVTHGRSGLGRWVLGSVTDKVLHATTNPLLIAHAQDEASVNPQPTLKNLIVPLDGSPLAGRVLPHVEALVPALGLNVILVRVAASSDDYYRYVDMSMGAAIDTSRFDEYSHQAEAEAATYLEKVKEQLSGKGVTSVEERLVAGSAAGAILDLAQETPDSLVALTTHGRSGVERWVLGSVTDRLVRHSGQPVLVIRADD
jgi:nucleotide-binding universal stress UspA family protein